MVRSLDSTSGATSTPELDAQKKQLKKACREFESVLTGFLMKSMRESIAKAEEPDQAQEIYQGMMDDTVARELSDRGSMGLGDMLYKQLLPQVEKVANRRS